MGACPGQYGSKNFRNIDGQLYEEMVPTAVRLRYPVQLLRPGIDQISVSILHHGWRL